jgi:hypothetical protein
LRGKHNAPFEVSNPGKQEGRRGSPAASWVF